MGKVGRNELCPCGSGKKYKYCCLIKRQAGQEVKSVAQPQVSLKAEVEKIQEHARNYRDKIKELGVFVLYANTDGDAWLFEISESDAVQLARAGEIIDISIDENPETIVIEWSHNFSVQDRRLTLAPYKDIDQEVIFAQKITQQLSASMRRIRKKCSPEQLDQVHINS